jgi:predicted amidohydrolase
MGKLVPSVDPAFLERAWASAAAAAARANVAVVLATERVVDARLLISALVVDRDGKVLGFQDKVQIDPSEEGTYSAGSGRQIFQTGSLTFGVVICHEVVATQKRSGGRLCAVLRSSSIRTFIRPNPAVTGPRHLLIRPIHSTRKLPCAARPRTPVTSQPSTLQVMDHRPRQQ